MGDMSELNWRAIQAWVHDRIETQLSTRLAFTGQMFIVLQTVDVNVRAIEEHITGEA